MTPPQLPSRSPGQEISTSIPTLTASLIASPAPAYAPTPPTNRLPSHKPLKKKQHEYSTNPNTVRARRRIARLTPYRHAIERAKQNDTKAVSAAWKERAKSKSFQAASEAKKNSILAGIEKAVMDRRRMRGLDYESKVAVLNQQYNVVTTTSMTEPRPSGSSAAAVADSRIAGRAGRRVLLHSGAYGAGAAGAKGVVPVPSNLAEAVDVVDVSQETRTPASEPDAPACTSNSGTTPTSTSASTSTPVSAFTPSQNETAQPTPACPAGSVASTRDQDLGSAIETLREQQEADKHRHKEDMDHLKNEMRQMHSVMETLREKVEKLSVADPVPQTTAQMQMYPFSQAPFAMTPSSLLHPYAHPQVPSSLEQHSHHYHHHLYQDQNGQNYQHPVIEDNEIIALNPGAYLE